MAPPPDPKKLPVESHAREAGLAAAEATAELLESGGYSFRHFDLGLVWPGAGGLRQAPVAVALAATASAAAVAQLVPGIAPPIQLLAASNMVIPLWLGAVGALTLAHVRDRLAGREPAASLPELLRGRLGLVAAALGLQLVLLPISVAMHAAAFHVVGVETAMLVTLVLGMAFQWVWTHVLARLALLGEGPFRALALGLADAVVYGLRAMAELPFYPGLWLARLRNEPDHRISAVDLLASQLIVRGLGAVGASLVTVLGLLLAIDYTGSAVRPDLYLYVAAQAFVGALALQVGLGRWAFYRLALAAEGGALAADPMGAAALPAPEGAP